MAKETKKKKIENVMHEFKEGNLHSGKNGINGIVKDRKQAIAIAINEADNLNKKK